MQLQDVRFNSVLRWCPAIYNRNIVQIWLSSHCAFLKRAFITDTLIIWIILTLVFGFSYLVVKFVLRVFGLLECGWYMLYRLLMIFVGDSFSRSRTGFRLWCKYMRLISSNAGNRQWLCVEGDWRYCFTVGPQYLRSLAIIGRKLPCIPELVIGYLR